MYIDTHAHLTDARYGGPEEVLARARATGVSAVISVGYNLESSARGAEIAETFPDVWFAPGIHPSDAAEATDEGLEKVARLLARPRAVILGEIGLDYHYEGTDRPLQQAAFVRQLELAHGLGFPVAIHARDCSEDMLRILKEHRALLGAGGIMHCFSGSREFARECLDLGLSLSFSGTVTFKNARKVQEVAAYVPEDRLLAETDCPYLSPEPHRGERNEPANVAFVYEKLAALRGTGAEEIAAAAQRNARRLMPRLDMKIIGGKAGKTE